MHARTSERETERQRDRERQKTERQRDTERHRELSLREFNNDKLVLCL